MKFFIKFYPILNCLVYNKLNIISIFTAEKLENRYNLDIINETNFYKIASNVLLKPNITYLFYYNLNDNNYIKNGKIQITKVGWFSNKIIYSNILLLCD